MLKAAQRHPRPGRRPRFRSSRSAARMSCRRPWRSPPTLCQDFDGFVALGCVVRGETDHYEFICAAAMDGLMQVATRQVALPGHGAAHGGHAGPGPGPQPRDRPQQGRGGRRGLPQADRAEAGVGVHERPSPYPLTRRRRAGAVPDRAGRTERRDRDRPVRAPPPRRPAGQRRVRGGARARRRGAALRPHRPRSHAAAGYHRRHDRRAPCRKAGRWTGSTRCCARACAPVAPSCG